MLLLGTFTSAALSVLRISISNDLLGGNHCQIEELSGLFRISTV